MWTGGCNLCSAVGVDLFRGRILLGKAAHPDLHDPPVLHPGDAHLQAVGPEPVAYVGHPPDLLHDPAGHRRGVVLLAGLHVEQVVQIVQIRRAGHQIAAVGLLPELLDDLVVLVPDLAHQLLHNVLHGDDALGAAVSVPTTAM